MLDTQQPSKPDYLQSTPAHLHDPFSTVHQPVPARMPAQHSTACQSVLPQAVLCHAHLLLLSCLVMCGSVLSCGP